MTLYILATNCYKQISREQKTIVTYLAVTAFCIIFNKIYALFGHDVSSAYMSLMFLYPLFGGVLLFLLLSLLKKPANIAKHYRFFYNLYNSGIAVLTVASALNGVFEIAGTSSKHIIIFLLVGWLMVVISLVAFLASLIKNKNE